VPAPRIIPSIEQLRQQPEFRVLADRYGRDAVLSAARDEAAALRAQLSGPDAAGDGFGDTIPEARAEIVTLLAARVASRLGRTLAPSLRPVVNATGVILHTNLGRAPLALAALARVAEIGRGYANLEYDLAAGGRGRRDTHAEALLTRLTGAEAAVVVNNNAAATLLLLAALARGREVVLSRGELVEIGGGFRVPEIMAQSGAILREVGTTNRTRLADYAAAVSDRTALILRVHPSNFRVEGFTERVAPAALVELGRRFAVPVAEDLGSGHLAGLAPDGVLPGEPTVQDSIAAGFDVVCFSGDKLLGGPQAGLLAGRAEAIDRIRRHPLMRAFRVDKMTYAALEATLLEHALGRAALTVPVAAMLAVTQEQLAARAERVAALLRTVPGLGVDVREGWATVGGGSAPGSRLPSVVVAIAAADRSAAALEAQLRALPVPVIGRIEDDRVVIDLRTVLPEQDGLLGEQLEAVLRRSSRSSGAPAR
jgi:L-seryl-tRNA(Ser) seleniumtransferase